MTAHHNWMFSIIAFENLLLLRFPKWDVREDLKKNTAYFMTSGKKVGGPKTKTKF